MIYLIHGHRELSKMREQRNTFQTKEQDQTSEKELNEIGLRNLPAKELKLMVINVITDLGGERWKNNTNFNRKIKSIRKYQTVVITELKNTLEGFKSRMDEVEECICELEDKINVTHPNRAEK